MTSFWDYALQTQRRRSDHFGDFVRLIGKGLVARPGEVDSSEALRSVLARERVDLPAEARRRLWWNFTRHDEATRDRLAKMPSPEQG